MKAGTAGESVLELADERAPLVARGRDDVEMERFLVDVSVAVDTSDFLDRGPARS